MNNKFFNYIDILPSKEPNPEQCLMIKELNDDVAFTIDCLTNSTKEILKESFGLDGSQMINEDWSELRTYLAGIIAKEQSVTEIESYKQIDILRKKAFRTLKKDKLLREHWRRI